MLTYFIAFLLSCQSEQTSSVVKVKKVEGISSFYVNGEKFDLRGVGFNWEYGHDFEGLKNMGTNAIRTWTTKYADSILPLAAKHQIKVAMGISIGKELWGFDYSDSVAVSKQFEKVKKQVLKYKDHSNLLCWVVGNELNLLFNEDGSLKPVNPKVYDGLAQIVDYIHEVDPNHPVTSTFAGVINDHLQVALERCPQLDIVSVQVYAGLSSVEQAMKDTGIKKPYMVTEFGPRGFWEMPKTPWGREIEEPSGPKADGIIERIEKGLTDNKSGNCLGGFAFVWGQKQERTPTWYGMHHKDGSQTEIIDRLTNLWTGKYPENRAPRVDGLLLDGKKSTDNIYVKPNQEYSAKVFASDPNNDPLTYTWVISKEVIVRSQGGEKELEPVERNVNVINASDGNFTFIAPEDEGDYRILVYVYDGKGKAGNANIPFYVKK